MNNWESPFCTAEDTEVFAEDDVSEARPGGLVSYQALADARASDTRCENLCDLCGYFLVARSGGYHDVVKQFTMMLASAHLVEIAMRRGSAPSPMIETHQTVGGSG